MSLELAELAVQGSGREKQVSVKLSKETSVDFQN